MTSQASKRELIREIRPRHTLGTRAAKRCILDELVATTGYHRKYAIYLLNHPRPASRRYASRCSVSATTAGIPSRGWLRRL